MAKRVCSLAAQTILNPIKCEILMKYYLEIPELLVVYFTETYKLELREA